MTDSRSTSPVVHRTAEFQGVAPALLRDGAALSGLLLSAAGAAGFTTAEPPIVKSLPRDGLAVILLLDLGHVTVHTIPAHELLLLDLLVPAGRDPEKAVDVFTRKFAIREARNGRRERGRA